MSKGSAHPPSSFSLPEDLINKAHFAVQGLALNVKGLV